jgi:hypothetical protein
MFCLYLHFFANFKAKIGRNGSKNEKRILEMFLRIPFNICLRSGRKSLYLNVECTGSA